jgi:hypothetical protein
MDDWFLTQIKTKNTLLYVNIEKGISDYFTGWFYSYVFDMQPSSNPIIQSSMGRQ